MGMCSRRLNEGVLRLDNRCETSCEGLSQFLERCSQLWPPISLFLADTAPQGLSCMRKTQVEFADVADHSSRAARLCASQLASANASSFSGRRRQSQPFSRPIQRQYSSPSRKQPM